MLQYLRDPAVSESHRSAAGGALLRRRSLNVDYRDRLSIAVACVMGPLIERGKMVKRLDEYARVLLEVAVHLLLRRGCPA